LADFEFIPIEVVRGQIYWGMGARVKGQSSLLGEGIRGSVRLGRLGIGRISKSAKKDRTPIIHQCQIGLEYAIVTPRVTCLFYLVLTNALNGLK
jgi:hypothetical protein